MGEWRQNPMRQIVGAPISGKRPAGGVNAETEGIPSLGGENIRAEGGMVYETINRIPETFFRSMPKGRLQAGDVLINKDGAQTGKVGMYDGRFAEAAVNEHVFILRSSNGAIDQRLLYYYVLLPETQSNIARRITGSAQPGLNSQFVDAVHLTIPADRDEQHRIAEILATIDEAIAQTEALIAKTRQIKAGLMHDLFTRGVTPDGQLRPPREEAPKLYKESPLGWIPKEWVASNAASEFDIASGVTLGPHRRPKRHLHPYLRVANVYAERLALQDVALLEAGADLPGKTLAADDLLVVEGHANPEEIGRCALATSEVEGFTFQNHLFRLRARRMMPALAVRWLNGRVVRAYWLRTCSASSGLNTINRTTLGAVPVVVPSPNEQRMLCAILDHVSGQIAGTSEECAKLRLLKSGLMHDLLTGRVRVPVADARAVAR